MVAALVDGATDKGSRMTGSKREGAGGASTSVGSVATRHVVPELDGLRFLAILSVLLWHASLRVDRVTDHAFDLSHGGGLYGLLPHGEIGVILFFAISGFLVSRSFDVRAPREWDIGRFYLKRLVRIYPPYLVALCGCFVVLRVIGHVPADAKSFAQGDGGATLTQSFLAGLVYLNGLAFDAPSRLNPPMWSLEVEIQFYALLPLVMLGYAALVLRSGGRWLVATATIALIAVVAWCSHHVQEDVRFRWGFLYHAAFFLTGIYLADARVLRDRGVPATVGNDVLFALGIAGLGGIGYSMTANDAHMHGSVYAALVEVGCMASAAAIVVGGVKGRVASSVLRWAPFRFVGAKCYSVYLTHIVVMQAVAEILPRFVRFGDLRVAQATLMVVLVAASVLVGWVFFMVVERPALRLNALVTPPGRRRAIDLERAGANRA